MAKDKTTTYRSQKEKVDSLALEEEVKRLTEENLKLSEANVSLRDKLKAPLSDCVVLDGKKRKIVHRDMAKEIGLSVRRSEVNENATVLVLDE